METCKRSSKLRSVFKQDWGKLSMVIENPLNYSNLTKACVPYFLSFFFFHQMIALQKLWKVILFLLKSFFHSQDIQTFVFFPFLSPLCKHKTTMEVEWFMMSWIGLHKFPDVIFRITEKLLYITSPNLER